MSEPLRHAAEEALVALAVFKHTDAAQPYSEISPTFRAQLLKGHDLLLEALSDKTAEQWEYTTRWHQTQPSDSYLNEMGAEGWELAAFNKASSQVWSSGWVFKRRVHPR